MPDWVSTIVAALRAETGKNQTMAYRVEMTVRLVELHRVLKPMGSPNREGRIRSPKARDCGIEDPCGPCLREERLDEGPRHGEVGPQSRENRGKSVQLITAS